MEKSEQDAHKEVGFVVNAKGNLLALEGLPSVRINDILEDDEGKQAMVYSLGRDNIQALSLCTALPKSGDRYFLRKEGLKFSIGDHLFGRIIDPFGVPIDGKGGFPKHNTELEFDVIASGINTREEISNQFHTGISLIDTLFPIGKGQRQLLFGPITSGKTTFMRDIIVNQKGNNVVCIYVGIGKPTTFVRRFAESIYTKGADSYAIILTALADQPTPVIAITPTVGVMIAEYFAKQGREVLLILDDLGAHAQYLREIALLMEMRPGRQSYPGDIFYQHAHLLERGGNFNKSVGGGSITVLPVLETAIENFTDLIPTNLMATTDGHLFFSAPLRAEGYYPPIAVDRSVTRVGRQTQKTIQKELATRIMALLVEYKQQKEYSRFGTNLSEKTKNTLRQGELVQELLRQEPFVKIEQGVQIALLSLLFTSFLEKREVGFLKKNKNKILSILREDPKFEDIRVLAERGSVTLDDFVEHYEKRMYILEKSCR